jgi:hypothetical protein
MKYSSKPIAYLPRQASPTSSAYGTRKNVLPPNRGQGKQGRRGVVICDAGCSCRHRRKLRRHVAGTCPHEWVWAGPAVVAVAELTRVRLDSPRHLKTEGRRQTMHLGSLGIVFRGRRCAGLGETRPNSSKTVHSGADPFDDYACTIDSRPPVDRMLCHSGMRRRNETASEG